MSSINTVYNQQSLRVTQNSALRKAATSSNNLPKLTNDENSLIKQNFTSHKPLKSYSMDGRVSDQQALRGSKFDARV